MDLSISDIEETELDAPSPGLSALLADLAADKSDDASCGRADDVLQSHQQFITTPYELSVMEPRQHQTVQTWAGFGSLNQPSPPGPFNPPPHPSSMGWAPQAPVSAPVSMHTGSNDAPSTQPALTSGLLAAQLRPGPYWHSATHSATTAAAAAAEAAAAGRRGRRPMPRLHELQQKLDTLTQQFQVLTQANTFLRGKLKLLESVLPYRDSHVGFLADVRNGQQPRTRLQYFRTKGYVTDKGPSAHAAAVAPAAAAAAATPVAAVAAPLAATASSGSSSSRTTSVSATAGVHVDGSYSHAAPFIGLATTMPGAALKVGSSAPQIFGIGGTLTGSTADGPLAGATFGRHLSHLVPELPGVHVATASIAAGAAATAAAAAANRLDPASASRVGTVAQGPDATAITSTLSGRRSFHSPMGHSAPTLGSWSAGLAVHQHLGEIPAVLALCPGPDGEVPAITSIALEQLKRVTARDFQMLYKHCVMQLAVVGTAAEVHGPSSPQHARLVRFLERIFVFMDQVVLLSPNCFVQSMYVNVETGLPEKPSDEFWRALGVSLNLTPEQREEIRMAMVMHEISVTPVAKERRTLASELSARICTATTGQRLLVSSGDVFKTLSGVDDVTERLRRNVIKEHQATTDVGDFVCMGVLTPVQISRVMAGSYPYIPDTVAVLHACETTDRDTTTTTTTTANNNNNNNISTWKAGPSDATARDVFPLGVVAG